MIFVNSIEDFSVDFSDNDLILAGKAYPKGTFAVNMLNRDKGKNTALLTEPRNPLQQKNVFCLPDKRRFFERCVPLSRNVMRTSCVMFASGE